jgi:hypothetical protein
MCRRSAVLLLLAFTSIGLAQSKESPDANRAVKKSGPASKTYRDTLRLLKAWVATQEDDQLGRLFAAAHARVSDLVTACSSADDEIAGAALLTLQLLGESSPEGCSDLVWQKQKQTALTFSYAKNLNDADFERIELWLAKTRTRTGFECGSEDGPLIDDSLMYALILDGSPRAESALSSMLALERACRTDTLSGETLEDTHSLIAEAKEIGHNLKLEQGVDKSIRASAFFLPPRIPKRQQSRGACPHA